ncbi:hypothetical protein BLNAU_352 [Blattamonas nauphoetae]|uniref:DNA polymerase delta subunit 3 n=1 Tax=Blattamonas nauphoetae TaxID=2049346 RepID=A0ABQ9YL03_9EUKA|nr:hypothetical protein BLNAU_352 [Blattamonas nauphoetae]
MDYTAFLSSALLDDGRVLNVNNLRSIFSITVQEARQQLQAFYDQNKENLQAIHYVVVKSNKSTSVLLLDEEAFHSLDKANIVSTYVYSLAPKQLSTSSQSNDVAENPTVMLKDETNVWSAMREQPSSWVPLENLQIEDYVIKGFNQYLPPDSEVETIRTPPGSHLNSSSFSKHSQLSTSQHRSFASPPMSPQRTMSNKEQKTFTPTSTPSKPIVKPSSNQAEHPSVGHAPTQNPQTKLPKIIGQKRDTPTSPSKKMVLSDDEDDSDDENSKLLGGKTSQLNSQTASSQLTEESPPSSIPPKSQSLLSKKTPQQSAPRPKKTEKNQPTLFAFFKKT